MEVTQAVPSYQVLTETASAAMRLVNSVAARILVGLAGWCTQYYRQTNCCQPCRLPSMNDRLCDALPWRGLALVCWTVQLLVLTVHALHLPWLVRAAAGFACSVHSRRSSSGRERTEQGLVAPSQGAAAAQRCKHGGLDPCQDVDASMLKHLRIEDKLTCSLKKGWQPACMLINAVPK